MGFHLALVPLQIPVETDGEGHAQDLQVPIPSAPRCGCLLPSPRPSLTPLHCLSISLYRVDVPVTVICILICQSAVYILNVSIPAFFLNS